MAVTRSRRIVVICRPCVRAMSCKRVHVLMEWRVEVVVVDCVDQSCVDDSRLGSIQSRAPCRTRNDSIVTVNRVETQGTGERNKTNHRKRNREIHAPNDCIAIL